MRAAHGGDHSGRRAPPAADADALLGGIRRRSGREPEVLRAFRLDAAPEHALCRRSDNADLRTTAAEKREIDREFVAPGDELAGTIEGIDEYEFAGEVFRDRGARRLFRDDGNAGKNAGESFEDHRFGHVIGKGDGRAVGLELGIECARPCGNNRARRTRDDRGKLVQKRTFFAADTAGCGHA